MNGKQLNVVSFLRKQPQDYLCQFLGRLKSDCDYYLFLGNRQVNRLWAKNVDDQIDYMKIVYGMIKVKPEFITESMIKDYERRMKV